MAEYCSLPIYVAQPPPPSHPHKKIKFLFIYQFKRSFCRGLQEYISMSLQIIRRQLKLTKQLVTPPSPSQSQPTKTDIYASLTITQVSDKISALFFVFNCWNSVITLMKMLHSDWMSCLTLPSRVRWIDAVRKMATFLSPTLFRRYLLMDNEFTEKTKTRILTISCRRKLEIVDELAQTTAKSEV